MGQLPKFTTENEDPRDFDYKPEMITVFLI